MITKLKEKDLVDFEDRVAEAFNNSEIKAPVHLYSGNETQILKIFEEIQEEDWVLCSWRSHYQCLLKGVPSEEIFNEILAGHSISLCFPDYKIFSSAIVGGILPIAVGIALAEKNKESKNTVHCFIGDMTSETGIAHEAIKYATNKDLPIRFIIEDNDLSVCTETRTTWGLDKLTYEEIYSSKVVLYKYKSKYPHAGAGQRVQF
jgi:pyruvate dehydrogenase E1 component alpha subunit